MKRAAWMIEQLRAAQNKAAGLIPVYMATDIVNDLQKVIDELQGERAAYLAVCNDALFGEAAERDGSAWTQKKEGK